jgi:hypothetical protein
LLPALFDPSTSTCSTLPWDVWTHYERNHIDSRTITKRDCFLI